MIKPVFLLLTLILLRTDQDVKVITYSTGRTDTDGYESLSFWIKSNQRAYVRYAHGKEAEDIELGWAGPDRQNNRKGFIVRFPAPDTLTWIITPMDSTLHVADRWGKYGKAYHWENENAGTGDSVCSICAQSSKQAMSWLRKYFLQ
ncbi:MAG TPA: hypothetical protein VGN00_28665 [Puia sp.]|jgi:hypothetical protein